MDPVTRGLLFMLAMFALIKISDLLERFRRPR